MLSLSTRRLQEAAFSALCLSLERNFPLSRRPYLAGSDEETLLQWMSVFLECFDPQFLLWITLFCWFLRQVSFAIGVQQKWRWWQRACFRDQFGAEPCVLSKCKRHLFGHVSCVSDILYILNNFFCPMQLILYLNLVSDAPITKAESFSQADEIFIKIYYIIA